MTKVKTTTVSITTEQFSIMAKLIAVELKDLYEKISYYENEDWIATPKALIKAKKEYKDNPTYLIVNQP